MTEQWKKLVLGMVAALAILGGVGLTAIGVSGGIAAAFGGAFGKSFVSGDSNGITYTPERCADFFEYYPDAADCEAAATAHHFVEVVAYRVEAGALGLVALGACWLLRRRVRDALAALPASFVPTAGAALFGLAAFLLLADSAGQLVFSSTTGVGQWLSGGIVSAVVFAGFAERLIRSIAGGPGRAVREPAAT